MKNFVRSPNDYRKNDKITYKYFYFMTNMAKENAVLKFRTKK